MYHDTMHMMPGDRHLSNVNGTDAYYENYIATTTDPGSSLFVVALCVCVGSFFGLPLFVYLGKRLSKEKHSEVEVSNNNKGIMDDGAVHHHPPLIDKSDLSIMKRSRHMLTSTTTFVQDNAIMRWKKHGARAGENMDLRRIALVRGVAKETRVQQAGCDAELMLDPSQKYCDQLETIHEQQPPHTPLCSFDFLRRSILCTTVTKYDNETKRILRLAIPFTCSSIIGTSSSLMLLVIISKTLGTNAMLAYVMVDISVGISGSFTGGWIEALSSLGSMAYGAENYELLGQYVQTSCILYVLSEIPMAFVWGFNIGKVMLWMGFDESVAVLSESYVWICVAMNLISGVNEANLDFLEVVEKESYANVMNCVGSVISVGFVALFALTMNSSLVMLGLVMMTTEALFLFLNVLIPYLMGWYKPFARGLFGKLILFRDTSVVKQLFKTALPLSFGGLLAYAEWEILIVFAAFLGPAEAASWAIVGFVWDLFESTTSAIGDASEVRCAYHLGKGNPAMAKLSAYKSMFLALVMSLLVTAVFLSLSGVLPYWLTHDTTIQAMIAELFPLIALGNISLTMGMVCWALIGAQGRYRLATSIATACSLLVTIPIGAILTIWLRIDLTGLVFAVVIGYTFTATLLTTCLLMSDWNRLAIKIQKKVAAEEGSDSDDDTKQDDFSEQGYTRAVLS